MKLLVLDSSGLVASVALIEDDQLIAEYTTGNKLTHSQTLLPMLDEVIKRTSFEIEDIDAVVVAKGPGSFTGLRIGAATAKGLGLALDKPIIPVPTVDGLAYQLFGTSMIICPMMDARRKQVYTGFYRFEGSEMKVLKEQCAQSVEDTLIQLREYNEPVVFLGDGVPVYKEEILEKMGDLALNLHQCLKIFPLYPSSALTCCFGVVVIAVPNINKKTNEKIVIFFNRDFIDNPFNCYTSVTYLKNFTI